jgi:hypothetical protein
MIYLRPIPPTEPILQGDIFRYVPRAELSLSKIAVVSDKLTQTTWQQIISEGPPQEVTVVVAVEPVYAIVITQNCDAARGKYLCLAQVDPFLESVGQHTPPKTAKSWKNLLTRHAKTNLRYFYLPEDPEMGFTQRMAADFRVVIRVPREDLEGMRQHRLARLNEVASEHFRESLGHFFRRYAYNEWYPLDKEEAEAYQADCPEPIELYDWQK